MVYYIDTRKALASGSYAEELEFASWVPISKSESSNQTPMLSFDEAGPKLTLWNEVSGAVKEYPWYLEAPLKKKLELCCHSHKTRCPCYTPFFRHGRCGKIS
jgi:hypothetical protein